MIGKKRDSVLYRY